MLVPKASLAPWWQALLWSSPPAIGKPAAVLLNCPLQLSRLRLCLLSTTEGPAQLRTWSAAGHPQLAGLLASADSDILATRLSCQDATSLLLSPLLQAPGILQVPGCTALCPVC